jgi:dihydrodipicolinate synthase/N-acetylneuraminate lyase
MPRYPQAVLVSCEAPWDENEQLLEEVFRAEVRQVLRHFNHLYIFGTAGEGYAVDTPRFQQIVRIFYEETRGPDVHPMVGVIGLSTANIIERIAFAHRCLDIVEGRHQHVSLAFVNPIGPGGIHYRCPSRFRKRPV